MLAQLQIYVLHDFMRRCLDVACKKCVRSNLPFALLLKSISSFVTPAFRLLFFARGIASMRVDESALELGGIERGLSSFTKKINKDVAEHYATNTVFLFYAPSCLCPFFWRLRLCSMCH